MFLVTLLLHVLFGVALISLCLGAPVLLAVVLIKSPLIMPELDRWWRSEQIRMLEDSTYRLAVELAEVREDGDELSVYQGRRR